MILLRLLVVAVEPVRLSHCCLIQKAGNERIGPTGVVRYPFTWPPLRRSNTPSRYGSRRASCGRGARFGGARHGLSMALPSARAPSSSCSAALSVAARYCRPSGVLSRAATAPACNGSHCAHSLGNTMVPVHPVCSVPLWNLVPYVKSTPSTTITVSASTGATFRTIWSQLRSSPWTPSG